MGVFFFSFLAGKLISAPVFVRRHLFSAFSFLFSFPFLLLLYRNCVTNKGGGKGDLTHLPRKVLWAEFPEMFSYEKL